jgi:hypothetical protein
LREGARGDPAKARSRKRAEVATRWRGQGPRHGRAGNERRERGGGSGRANAPGSAAAAAQPKGWEQRGLETGNVLKDTTVSAKAPAIDQSIASASRPAGRRRGRRTARSPQDNRHHPSAGKSLFESSANARETAGAQDNRHHPSAGKSLFESSANARETAGAKDAGRARPRRKVVREVVETSSLSKCCQHVKCSRRTRTQSNRVGTGAQAPKQPSHKCRSARARNIHVLMYRSTQR